MTKLEEKLLQLGYERNWQPNSYIKINGEFEFIINIKNGKVGLSYVQSSTEMDVIFYSQNDVDYFQQAFNQLQKDLEVLRNEGSS